MSITDDIMKAVVPDPFNELSVKEYNNMKIQEKKDQINGCRERIFKTMEIMGVLEKELINLVLEQVNGDQLPIGRNCVHCKGTLYPSGDECSC